MNIGKTIKEIRIKRTLTQGDLAEKSNITQSYLSSIEQNKREPLISTLKDISDALDVPLPIIFFLSIDEKDIPENKKIIYDALYPSIKGMVLANFLEE